MPRPKPKAAPEPAAKPKPFVYDPFPGVADRKAYLVRYGYDPEWVDAYLKRFCEAQAAAEGHGPGPAKPSAPPPDVPEFNPFDN